jgi:hypothetical protein
VGSPFSTIITQIVNSKFGSLDATKGPPPHLPLLFVAPKRATVLLITLIVLEKFPLEIYNDV